MSHPIRRAAHLLAVIAGGLSAVAALSSLGVAHQASPQAFTDEIADRPDAIDRTDAILSSRGGSCLDHALAGTADVEDVQRSKPFRSSVLLDAENGGCVLISNNIPNHDFNDETADFHHPVSEIMQRFFIPANPTKAARPAALSQRAFNGVMLNGVPIDLLSAGCYRPNGRRADADGNVAIGCRADDKWLLDPLGTDHKFGVDAHNAHTQPGGMYHYHGNPMALFDDQPGRDGSPVIGFAADGFPVFGSYFKDETGTVRKARSGYRLKSGARPKSATDPGGAYDGMYVDDWEFAGTGDLDACNGMTVNGQYGYYVTDSYPWILACLSGTPDPSFAKPRPARRG
jgi:hypothetical protein